MDLPGPGTVFISQNCRFTGPVYIGDTVTADATVLLIVVKKHGIEVTREALLGYLADKVPKWWLPDDVVFVEQLPHTATGKLQKAKLREMFAGYRFSQA